MKTSFSSGKRPNCFLETGSNEQGAAGNTAMQLCSKNDVGHQMNISHHGSGLGRIHNDGTLEITSGQLKKAVQSESGQGLLINNAVSYTHLTLPTKRIV